MKSRVQDPGGTGNKGNSSDTSDKYTNGTGRNRRTKTQVGLNAPVSGYRTQLGSIKGR